jgi:hypothetical protein
VIDKWAGHAQGVKSAQSERADSHLSAARCVRQGLIITPLFAINKIGVCDVPSLLHQTIPSFGIEADLEVLAQECPPNR